MSATLRDTIDLLYGPPLGVLSSCLRGMMIARPGYKLIASDLNAIEARKLAWLAGEEKVLHVFRTHGMLYEAQASEIYFKSIDTISKLERLIGKVAILALGYQGGVGAFQSMAKVYGVKIPDAQAEEIKQKWRAAHPKIVQYWYDLERAAMAAVMNPGQVFYAGPKDHREIRYQVRGSFLACRLPSGRKIYYPYPKIKEVEMPWGALKDCLTYKAEDSFSRKFEEQKAYGGLLAENVTQASARDVLAGALVRLEDRGYPAVMHAHDEAVSEVLDDPKYTVTEHEAIMSEVPVWAKGLPIAASGFEGKRYKK